MLVRNNGKWEKFYPLFVEILPHLLFVVQFIAKSIGYRDLIGLNIIRLKNGYKPGYCNQKSLSPIALKKHLLLPLIKWSRIKIKQSFALIFMLFCSFACSTFKKYKTIKPNKTLTNS